MAKKNTKRNNGTSGGKRIALITLAAILIAAIVGGGVYAAWKLTDGFTHLPWQTEQPEEDPGKDSGTDPGVISGDYYVELDGVKYGDNGVARLASGSVFTVGAGFGSGYSVKLTARKAASDISFTLGAEPYKWSNVAGDDFTEGFTITKTGTGFTVEFGTLAEIISAVKGNDVTIPEGENATVPDKFTMAVTAANGQGIALNFTMSALDIGMDPDHIIFGDEQNGDAGTDDVPTEGEYWITYDLLTDGSGGQVDFSDIPGSADAGESDAFRLPVIANGASSRVSHVEVQDENTGEVLQDVHADESGLFRFTMPSCNITIMVYMVWK